MGMKACKKWCSLNSAGSHLYNKLLILNSLKSRTLMMENWCDGLGATPREVYYIHRLTQEISTFVTDNPSCPTCSLWTPIAASAGISHQSYEPCAGIIGTVAQVCPERKSTKQNKPKVSAIHKRPSHKNNNAYTCVLAAAYLPCPCQAFREGIQSFPFATLIIFTGSLFNGQSRDDANNQADLKMQT